MRTSGVGLTVLDASALIAGLVGGRAMGAVIDLFDDPHDAARVASVNLAECADVLERRVGFSREGVISRLRLLAMTSLDVVAVDEDLALVAGSLRATHYDRETNAVSLADCVAIATAKLHEDRLATLDRVQAATARLEGIEVIDLSG